MEKGLTQNTQNNCFYAKKYVNLSQIADLSDFAVVIFVMCLPIVALAIKSQHLITILANLFIFTILLYLFIIIAEYCKRIQMLSYNKSLFVLIAHFHIHYFMEKNEDFIDCFLQGVRPVPFVQML